MIIRITALALCIGAAVLGLAACGGLTRDPVSVQLLRNGSMEDTSQVAGSKAPQHWQLLAQNFTPPNNFRGEITDSVAFAGRRSVFVEARTIDEPSEYWAWVQTLPDFPIRSGSNLRFRYRMRSENLRGNGFRAFLFCIHSANPNQSFLLEDVRQTQVSGTADWREFGFDYRGFDPNIREVQVWLAIAPNTTGRVYFDDVRLDVVQP